MKEFPEQMYLVAVKDDLTQSPVKYVRGDLFDRAFNDREKLLIGLTNAIEEIRQMRERLESDT